MSAVSGLGMPYAWEGTSRGKTGSGAAYILNSPEMNCILIGCSMMCRYSAWARLA